MADRIEQVDFVFDGPPGPVSPRLIEIEGTEGARSVTVGEWLKRPDGAWVLRVRVLREPPR